MPTLLDVNVLIALLEPAHIHHQAAHRWFSNGGEDAWASCPITQNGFVRIVSQARYPYRLEPALAAETLAGLIGRPGHRFWPDSISLLDSHICDPSKLHASRHVTDSYLLALAVANGGRLATFDAKLATTAVAGGHDAKLLLSGTDIDA